MSLRRVTTWENKMGGIYVENKLHNIVRVSGTLSIDLSRITASRKRKVVTALERGFSRGNGSSEQYLLYSLLCQKFGLRPARITSGRYNKIPLPDGANVHEFKKKLKEHLVPRFQLVGATPPSAKDEDKWQTDYWWGMNERKDSFGSNLSLHKPHEIPMHVFAKILKDFLPVKDPAKINAAVLFVNAGGTIDCPLEV